MGDVLFGICGSLRDVLIEIWWPRGQFGWEYGDASNTFPLEYGGPEEIF